MLRKLAGYDRSLFGVVEGQPDREAVAHRGDRRGFGDQSQDLTITLRRVVDVLRTVVERAECRNGGDEHPHRMSVVVEAVDEPLAHVLVDERVVRDVADPGVELRLVRQLAVQQQIGDLEVRRVLRELLDRVAAVAQDPRITVEVGDRRLARRRREVRRVVAVQRRVELTQCRRRKHPAFDGNGDGLSGAVVGDGDGVGHVASSRGANSLSVPPEVPPRPRRHNSAVSRMYPQPAGRMPAYTSTAEPGSGVGQSGLLPCLRPLNTSRLSTSASSAAAISRRVSAGSITASTSPRSAATYGLSSRCA